MFKAVTALQQTDIGIMNRPVIRFGLISAGILIGLTALGLLLFGIPAEEDYAIGEIIGYASIVISLIPIFFDDDPLCRLWSHTTVFFRRLWRISAFARSPLAPGFMAADLVSPHGFRSRRSAAMLALWQIDLSRPRHRYLPPGWRI